MPTVPKTLVRDVKEADLPRLFEIQREPEGYKMAVVAPRDEAEFFRHWRENILSSKDVIVKTVEVDGEVAGDVRTWVLEGRRTLGYWIAKKYWGRGIATVAVTEFLKRHEKHRPLLAFVAVQNVASFRVLQKCGFRQIGDAAKASDGIEEYRFELA